MGLTSCLSHSNSVSLLRVISVLTVGILLLSMSFFPASGIGESKGKVATDLAKGVALIAGGIAILASSPVVVTVSSVVALGGAAYAAGYYITDLIIALSDKTETNP